jgi:hypothetical protein
MKVYCGWWNGWVDEALWNSLTESIVRTLIASLLLVGIQCNVFTKFRCTYKRYQLNVQRFDPQTVLTKLLNKLRSTNYGFKCFTYAVVFVCVA